jgi:hypothetical protein
MAAQHQLVNSAAAVSPWEGQQSPRTGRLACGATRGPVLPPSRRPQPAHRPPRCQLATSPRPPIGRDGPPAAAAPGPRDGTVRRGCLRGRRPARAVSPRGSPCQGPRRQLTRDSRHPHATHRTDRDVPSRGPGPLGPGRLYTNPPTSLGRWSVMPQLTVPETAGGGSFTMGVVRARRFSHSNWATSLGSWVTFGGLGRLGTGENHVPPPGSPTGPGLTLIHTRLTSRSHTPTVSHSQSPSPTPLTLIHTHSPHSPSHSSPLTFTLVPTHPPLTPSHFRSQSHSTPGQLVNPPPPPPSALGCPPAQPPTAANWSTWIPTDGPRHPSLAALLTRQLVNAPAPATHGTRGRVDPSRPSGRRPLIGPGIQ